jgi:hypothetical protein
MDLPLVFISQHPEIEPIVFRSFPGKCALLDSRHKQSGRIPVIWLIHKTASDLVVKMIEYGGQGNCDMNLRSDFK